jgi:CheY-like chemotaxis protein
MKMKLLIVEDNKRMREMLKENFKDMFSEIIECEDGSEALAAYRDNLPNWVFMDIRMKKMDGIKATKKITECFPDAKILIVTGIDDNEIRKEAAICGATDYVLKENLEEIFNIISNK